MARWVLGCLLIVLSQQAVARTSPLQRSDFEAILVPSIYTMARIPGAEGSLWETELWVRNTSDEPVIFGHGTPWCFVCGPPARPIYMQPKQTISPVPVVGNFDPRLAGMFYVEKKHADKLFFSLRIRDLSRNAETAGTAIPVAREDDFYPGAFELLNLPVTGGRINLRIYEAQTKNTQVRVVLLPLTGEDIHASRIVNVNLPIRDDENFPYLPSEALILDLASWLPPEVIDPIRIRIEPLQEGQYWGFATITNNSTQQVTIVAPQ